MSVSKEQEVTSRPDGERLLNPAEIVLRDRLGAGVKQTVERMCGPAWTPRIKDYLREEMNLTLKPRHAKTPPKPVKVSVVDGFPASVARILNDYTDPTFWDLVLRRKQLENSLAGIEFLKELMPEVLSFIGAEHEGIKSSDIERVVGLVKRILQRLSTAGIIEKVLLINEGIYGAYFAKDRRIEIYWMSIGLAAGSMGFDVKDVALVVLIHELAHSHSHVGYDLDDVQWRLADFGQTDKHVKEGLAQFCTQSMCEHLGETRPGALLFFRRMLAEQERLGLSPYVAYRDWAEENESAREAVHQAMLVTRRKGLKRYDEFLKTLNEERAKLGVQLRTGATLLDGL